MNYHPYEARVPLGRCAVATLTRASEADPWRVVVRPMVPWQQAERVTPEEYKRVTGQELSEGSWCYAYLDDHFGKEKQTCEQPIDLRVDGKRVGPGFWYAADNIVWRHVEDGEAFLKTSGWTPYDGQRDFGFVRELEKHIAEVDPDDTALREDVDRIREDLRRADEKFEAERREDQAYIDAHGCLPPAWQNVIMWSSYGYYTGRIEDLPVPMGGAWAEGEPVVETIVPVVYPPARPRTPCGMISSSRPGCAAARGVRAGPSCSHGTRSHRTDAGYPAGSGAAAHHAVWAGRMGRRWV